MSRDAFVERCRRDRDELFLACRARLGAPEDFTPADWLDDILTELLGFDLVEEALPFGQIALCDLDRRCLVLSTRRGQSVRPNTDLAALGNSSKAHELGHVRLHEEELRQCVRLSPPDPLDPEQARREQEADRYACVFLVPETLLEREPAFQRLLQAHRNEESLDSLELWDLTLALASRFGVSGSLMRRLLTEDLGLLELLSEDRSLRVKPR